jgi:hypothetical protein
MFPGCTLAFVGVTLRTGYAAREGLMSQVRARPESVYEGMREVRELDPKAFKRWARQVKKLASKMRAIVGSR